MKKCLGISPAAWKAATTPEARQALIDASHVDLTPAEQAARAAEEAAWAADAPARQLREARYRMEKQLPRIQEFMIAYFKEKNGDATAMQNLLARYNAIQQG